MIDWKFLLEAWDHGLFLIFGITDLFEQCNLDRMYSTAILTVEATPCCANPVNTPTTLHWMTPVLCLNWDTSVIAVHCVHYGLTWIVVGFWQGSIVSNHTRYLALTGNYANCCFASKLVNLSCAVSNLNAYWWLLYEYTNSTLVLSEFFFINYICTVWCCQSNRAATND